MRTDVSCDVQGNVENLEIVMKPVNSIIPYWRNPRRNDKTVEELAKVIEKNGFNVPIVVDKNNVVVKGHARLKAAKRLGMTEVPCIVSNASEEVIKADRVADNKIQELSAWDFGKLNVEIDRLPNMTFKTLFRPDDTVKEGIEDMPDVQFTPVSISGYDFGEEQTEDHPMFGFGGAEAGTIRYGGDAEVEHGGDQPVSGGMPAPEKKTLKTLCPYCGKLVTINV